MIKRIAIKFILLLSLWLLAHRSQASHSMGADITYQCMGGNTYKVILTFYRDCIGVNAPNNPVVTISSASCSQSFTLTCHARPGTGQDITPACSTTVTTCYGGAFTGIQEWVYDATVTLPMQCTDWVFSYSLCCRNAAITTISNPASNTFYIYATLNNTISPGNNSPTFSNKPVPFTCIGEQYYFNHGAYDLDGDSLVYSLINPLQSASNPVTYNAPYNASQPLNSSPAVSFNITNGEIFMNPQAIEVTVMAVLVREYRNGVLIGSVERDMQITVMNCNNHLPDLSGINGTTNFTLTICANIPTCFDIITDDPDTGQILTVSWNNTIPGATFTSNNSAFPTGTFCWTPTTANIGKSYTFTARVADDACPYFGSQIRSYTIKVIGISADAGPDQTSGCNSNVTLSANASGGSGVYSYVWNNGSSNQSINIGVGNYIITVSDGTCPAIDTVVVNPSANPAAIFTSSVPGCYKSPVNFSDQSTVTSGTITNWDWDFGDGNTSTNANPSHQYSSSGTYTVNLIVTSSSGCKDTIQQTISFLPPPTSVFSTSNSCTGTSIPFTDQSTSSGAINYWAWDFGDNTSSSSQNPSHTYNTPGTYTVTLTAGDAAGCLDTTSHLVTIYKIPTLNIGATNTCFGTGIPFMASVGMNDTINSYSWNFGNGNTSTMENPNYTYGTAGTYAVTLTATNNYGCSDTASTVVVVYPTPSVNSGPDKSLCQGGSTLLSATNATYSYQWTPGNYTTQSITVSPTTTTNYTVQITDANGCTNSDSVQVVVHALPNIATSPDQNICDGSTIIITATGASSYTWYPGNINASSISITPSASTTYSVTGTDLNGCQSSDTINVSVNSLPILSLTPKFICKGESTMLDAGNSGATYLWNTGETTQTIMVSDSGTYSVVVNSNSGCSTSSNCYVTAGGTTLAANPTNISVCSGVATSFDAGNPGSNYIWSTGETTQIINPNATGDYAVTITDATGCSITFINFLTINPLPTVDFSTNPVCFQTPASFNNQSTVGNGNIVSYSWTFGDGAVSSSASPSYNYSIADTFTVTLIAITNQGCTDSVTHSVVVHPTPNAYFTIQDICQGFPVNFVDSSTISGGNISSMSWDFGDGNSSTSSQILHNYNTYGTFPVNLTVTSDQGCPSTLTQNLTIYPSPLVNFSTNPACFQTPVAFTNQSTVGNGNIASYNWTLGDGSTTTQASPSHNYSIADTFTVTLVATTNHGCMDSVTHSTVVHPTPNAYFSIKDRCQGLPVNFVDSSTITGGNISSVSWNFGDGNSSTSSQEFHSYNIYGTFNVNLTVTSDQGCTSSLNQNLNIFPAPSVAFIDSAVCIGRPTHFYNKSSVPSGKTFTSYWAFANGDTSTLDNPVYTFTSPGFNPVSLTVTTSDQCENKIMKTSTVYEKPVAQFLTTDHCYGIPTSLQDQSVSTDGSITSWSWDFGDGNYSNSNTPSHTYQSTGSYSVSLSIATNYGCGDTISGILNIHPTPAPIFSVNNACLKDSFYLSDISPSDTAAGLIYQWDLGDGNSSANSNLNYSYSNAGIYNITLTVSNQYSCSASLSKTIEVYALPMVNFTGNNVCFNSTNSFMNSSAISAGNIANYSWSFGDGSTSSIKSPTHLYSSPGTYTVSLVATSDHGCVNYAVRPVIVDPNPVAAFTGGAQGCGTVTANFTDASYSAGGPISQWLWNFGDGDFSSIQNPYHPYNQAGTYSVTLTVTTTNGCKATTSMQGIVAVYPSPSANFTMDHTVIDQLNPMVHFSNHSQGYTYYQWDFGDGTTTSNDLNPSHVYTDTATYTVQLIVTNAQGCNDTSYRFIEMKSKSTFFVPNSFTPNGDGLNDVFSLHFTQMKDIEVWIFDRWGTMINSWHGVDGTWDGTYKGEPVKQDVYVYQAKGIGDDDKYYDLTGSITVVR